MMKKSYAPLGLLTLLFVSCSQNGTENSYTTIKQEKFQTTVESDIAKVKNDAISLNFTLEHLDSKIHDLKKQLSKLEEETIRELENKIDDFTQTYAKMTARFQEMEHQLETMNQRVIEFQKIALLAQQNHHALKDTLENLQEKVLQNEIQVAASEKKPLFPLTIALEKHIIERGETLERIASKYHTSVATLKALNHLQSDTVTVGQEIFIPQFK